jgi:hypothetical protein
MTAETNDRAECRAQAQTKRDRDRRVRGLALRTVAVLVEQDPTVSGFTIITPDGTVEYLDADMLRRGGRA